MKKKATVEELFDPTFDDTLCGRCFHNNKMGQCYKFDIPIPYRDECESYMEDEDIGMTPTELGVGQDESN